MVRDAPHRRASHAPSAHTTRTPRRSRLAPSVFRRCQWLAALLPAGFAAPIAIIQNWTYAVFYTMAELWGSVVASLLFWGFANELTSVPEAKKYYPLFGLGAAT